MIIGLVTHPQLLSIVSGFFFSGTHCKGVSKQLCVYHLYRNVFLAQTRFRYHLGCLNSFPNAFPNAFLELSRYHRFLISRVRGMPGMLSLRSCIAQFHPKHNAFKRVSKQLRVYLLYRSVFLAQTRFRSPPFFRVEKCVSIPHNQNSFAFIICKRCF